MKNSENNDLLLCPVCKTKLLLNSTEKSFSCVNNHNFDLAKQGYLNLLTNNQKKTKSPGDSKDMVKARMEFLSNGYYDILSDRINECIIEQLKNIHSDFYNILDIGCGTGYYTNKLMQATEESGIPASYFGLDMSKDAVKYASMSNKLITWVVANSYHIPFEDNSFDCIMSIFSPVEIEECKRIMKNDGVFIRVLPGINHLIQIRNIIYDKVILNQGNDQIDVYEGLKNIDMINVCFDVPMKKEDVLSLVRMTPHYWKTSKADKEPLNDIDNLKVTIDMRILIYKKSS